jgi:hypothetical protein
MAAAAASRHPDDPAHLPGHPGFSQQVVSLRDSKSPTQAIGDPEYCWTGPVVAHGQSQWIWQLTPVPVGSKKAILLPQRSLCFDGITLGAKMGVSAEPARRTE